MARYSDLKRGPELAAAYTAYQAYLAKDRAAKKAAYKALNVNRLVATRVLANIAPFGSLALYIPMMVPSPTPAPDTSASDAESKEADSPLVTLIQNTLLTRSAGTPTDADAVIRIPKFKAAKLFIKRTTGDAATQKTSRFTNIPYKHRQSNTISSPFGKENAADTYDAAVAEISSNDALRTHVVGGGTFRIVPQMSIIA